MYGVVATRPALPQYHLRRSDKEKNRWSLPPHRACSARLRSAHPLFKYTEPVRTDPHISAMSCKYSGYMLCRINDCSFGHKRTSIFTVNPSLMNDVCKFSMSRITYLLYQEVYRYVNCVTNVIKSVNPTPYFTMILLYVLQLIQNNVEFC